MNYKMEAHIPSQIETLLHHRSNADITSFEYILDGIRIMMKEHQSFLDALDADMKKRVDESNNLFTETKKLILTAFKNKTDEEGVTYVHGVVSQLEQAYNALELQYMNDVLTTCSSYQQDDNGTGNE